MLGPLHWLDWLLLALLAASIFIGVVRGLVLEITSLAGFAVAYFGAVWATPSVAAVLPIGKPGSAINHSAGLLSAFVFILLAWLLVMRMTKQMTKAAKINPINRTFGAVLGTVRGFLILMAIATVVKLTPAAQSAAWQESPVARWLSATVMGAKPLLPEVLAQWLS